MPSPRVVRPWDAWCAEVEAAIKAQGRWAGSHAAVLGWAQEKLNVRSAQDRKRSPIEGWDTPEGLLARWVRLRRLDMMVVGNQLVVRARPLPARKVAPNVPAPGPMLLEDE